MLLLFFRKLFRINRLAILYYNSAGTDLWKMGFKDFRRIVDGNRNYRAICLRCNLKASLMEGEHFQLAVMFVSGPFRKDTDGHTVFDLIYSSENGFQSFFDILSVQKKAVEIFHPVGQQRN